MKKNYRIILLLVIFIFLSTYTTKNLNFLKKNDGLFKIKNIYVINNSIIEEKEIKKKLDDIYNKNILTINKSKIYNPLLSIKFLDKIEVKKKYPSTIIIKVFETKPVAILFKKKIKYFLDSSSNLILFTDEQDYGELPSIFGESAELYFADFQNKLTENNFPYSKIKNYYYQQIGRWDLQLLDDKIIKFPETKIIKAIRKSIELLKRDDFKNYKVFDLRINDKIIVE